MSEDSVTVKTQQGFSFHTYYISIKDADLLHQIFYRNGIWHTIKIPGGKEEVFAPKNRDRNPPTNLLEDKN